MDNQQNNNNQQNLGTNNGQMPNMQANQTFQMQQVYSNENG